jgi:hypothetical protein
LGALPDESGLNGSHLVLYTCVKTASIAVALAFVVVLSHAGEHKTITISERSFAAIAYSPSTGKYGYAYDRSSRKSAEDGALKDCDAPDATIACWVNRGFCALGLGGDKSCYGAGWSYGSGASTDPAGDQALAECKKCSSGGSIWLALSSDGQYVFDKRDHMTITDKNGNVYDGRGNLITSASETKPSPNTSPSVAPSGAAAPAESSLLKTLRKKSDDGDTKK